MTTNKYQVARGRELDGIVAVRVMGWNLKERWGHEGASGSCCTHFWYRPDNDISPDGKGHTQRSFPSGNVSGDPVAEIVPHYSSELAAAFKVVDKIPFRLELTEYAPDDGEMWMAKFMSAGCVQGKAEADNPATAICLAALAALSHEVK